MTKTIECRVTVDENHCALLQLPRDVEPGNHRLVVEISDAVRESTEGESFHLPLLSVGAWPDGLKLSRQEMYGDDGR
jgi:hypothetical protein